MFTSMMSFCKKSVHSFLGLSDSIDTNTNKPFPLPTTALGLATATAANTFRSPNVVESSTVKSVLVSSPIKKDQGGILGFIDDIKKDPGGIGFIDDIGGGVDGLMSCTESLGFESSDERRVDDDEMNMNININVNIIKEDYTRKRIRSRRLTEKKTLKSFPPPISSLNQNGKPSFFLRPVRKDGRLELTEVRIDRPEILRASREDGRLRLHLIKENDIQEEEEEEEDVLNDEKIQEEDEKVDDFVKFPLSGASGGESFRRCHEAVSHHSHHHHHHHHHQHHNMHVWRQHCVTTS